MGFAGIPLYGDEDFGSAIEQAEIIIKKIKTNKYTKRDVQDLYFVLEAIENVIADTAED